jgi:hypothetical protein
LFNCTIIFNCLFNCFLILIACLIAPTKVSLFNCFLILWNLLKKKTNQISIVNKKELLFCWYIWSNCFKFCNLLYNYIFAVNIYFPKLLSFVDFLSYFYFKLITIFPLYCIDANLFLLFVHFKYNLKHVFIIDLRAPIIHILWSLIKVLTKF